MVYDKLAVERDSSRKPVFVFWDRKCLVYSQNWEQGFLNGLMNSQVIVLLISTKVCICFIFKFKKLYYLLI